MDYILIQNLDEKTAEYKKAAVQYNIELLPMKHTEILIPFYLIKNYFKLGVPLAVVYRYLNDHSSLMKTLIRTASEITTLLLCKILKIKIVWICHNIDRESISNYPQITKMRRALFVKNAYKILVTDKLLVNYAKRYFSSRSKDINFITFGEINQNPKLEKTQNLTNLITQFVNHEKQNHSHGNLIIGLSVGKANWKTAHFERVIELLNKSEETKYKLRMIIVGPLGAYYDKVNPSIIENLENDPRVLFINEMVLIDELEVSKHVDFIWRSYKDISTPFTIYHAASINIPVLSQGPGFVAEMVHENSLGAVVKGDFTDLEESMNKIMNWDTTNANKFMETHNWNVGVKNIIEACR